jgi:hypothetical protein
MILNNLRCLLLAGVVAAVPLSHGIAHPVGAASATEAGVVTVQGWPGWQGGPGWSPDQERREHAGACGTERTRSDEAPPLGNSGAGKRRMLGRRKGVGLGARRTDTGGVRSVPRVAADAQSTRAQVQRNRLRPAFHGSTPIAKKKPRPR